MTPDEKHARIFQGSSGERKIGIGQEMGEQFAGNLDRNNT